MDSVFNEDQKRLILAIAREAAIAELQRSVPFPRNEEAVQLGLNIACGGCFVTYKNNGRLRGCIGIFEPREPLFVVIASRAVAALYDHRFRDSPITPNELMTSIKICVSVLTTPVPTTDPLRDVVVGLHGVSVKRGRQMGTYLPQVAVEHGWDVRIFLEHLARVKAGIDSIDVFNDPAVEWKMYAAATVCE